MSNLKLLLLTLGASASLLLATVVWHSTGFPIITSSANENTQVADNEDSAPNVLGASKIRRNRWWRKQKTQLPQPPPPLPPPLAPATQVFKMLKDVGEPFYSHFGLDDSDFSKLKNAGVTVIEGNFDICANPEDVDWLLDTAQKYSIKVVMNAGAGEAEWGYVCDAPVPPDQKPFWEKNKVITWVKQWKDYPAVYAWDTSNEAGGNFPNAQRLTKAGQPWEPEFEVSLAQLREAYQTVKQADPHHPIIARMNGWYFYDFDHDFFRAGNRFGTGVADIVMVNTYSNVNGRDPAFVSTIWERASKSILEIDPHVKFISSLASWQAPPIFVQMPTVEILKQEITDSLEISGMIGVSFFKYGASKGIDWLLPDTDRGNSELWQTISEM